MSITYHEPLTFMAHLGGVLLQTYNGFFVGIHKSYTQAVDNPSIGSGVCQVDTP